MSTRNPLQTIEQFGQVCALLDDGFGARAQILAAAGLDEAGWQRLRAKYLPMLASNQAPATAIGFSRAYACARQQLALPEAEPMPQSVAPVSVDDDPTEPDAEPRAPDMDCTTDHAFPLAGPALPFRPAGSAMPMQAPAPHRLCDAADVTLETPGAAAPASPVLPFVAPPAVGRRQRLIHFEPSTGRRLAHPVWVDELEFVEPTVR